ncbi:glycosyltransferase family A protein [Gottfriedia sp. NPDC058432]|uniref:glycosyltransferase family A protein n=1 Tax=Gottfriedia sp. NPDC058432 TaxID=3346497 RepID=UPI003661A9C8
MSKFLTILTPTFNRSKLLIDCYVSLKNQTLKDFEWIIIDDGSIDDTKAIVAELMSKNEIDIKYFYKENGGKHTALNEGVKHAQGKLSLILDSDDRLTPDAVGSINNYYKKYKEQKEIGSISFLRCYSDGKIIGDTFNESEIISTYIDLIMNKGTKGDKSEVFVTDILRKYPFPVYKNERFIGEHVAWVRIARKYKTLYINKPIYITEYLEGGLTKSGRRLRINCPLGGIESSKETIDKNFNWRVRIKSMMLYICYGFFAKKKLNWMSKNSKQYLLFWSTLPAGIMLYHYWNVKYNN